MKRKTKNRISAVADLAKLVVEKTTPLGKVEEGTRVTRDAYTIGTGRKLRLSDLPPGIRKMERRR